MRVSKVADMREMDRRMTEEYGVSNAILMENASDAAYSVIRQESGVTGKRFVLVCGPGNNGGDAFALARKLFSNGGQVKVFHLVGREQYRMAARENIDILLRLQVDVRELNDLAAFETAVNQADAVVDGILGTGTDRPVKDRFGDVIRILNKSGKEIYALDIASGINGDTGQVMGTAVNAGCTISFGLPKPGNLLYPGYTHGGKLYVSHISFPPALHHSPSLNIAISRPGLLPERRPDASKMDFGPVLVIAGASSYYWAPYAAAYSILKAGGGYVYLACPRSLVSSLSSSGKEIVFRPLLETETGSISLSNKRDLLELAGRVKMVVIGPGLSLDGETQELVKQLVAEIEQPLLIDGDGLTAIASDIGIISRRKSPTVLTPHSGEMARLMQTSREEIESDRIKILEKALKTLNSIIVLKGPHSLTGYPDGRIFINTTGETSGKSGLATAGTGDVLTGTIAAMFCLGMSIEEAARTGVFIHGLAGDLATKQKGADGITAQDVLDFLPNAMRYYRDNLAALQQNYADTVFIV